MSCTKKLEEGFEKIKLAEKSLKTSFLKWRPNHETAADEYSQAATCFKNARSFERSKDCLLKAAECHRHNNSFFNAAKCIDQAILLAKELNDYKEVAQLAEKACNLYQQHGSPESAAASLDKAGKILEQIEPEQAIRLFKKAVDVVLTEDSPRQAAEFLSKIARICVRLQMYDEASEAIRREIGIQLQEDQIPAVGRLTVALVLVHLARGDFIAAEKVFKEWGNCCDNTEIDNVEMLLQGYDEEDGEAVRKALNHPFIKHMDVEYSRLARDLPLPEGICTQKCKTEKIQPPYVSLRAQHAKESQKEGGMPGKYDDEDEEGLC